MSPPTPTLGAAPKLRLVKALSVTLDVLLIPAIAAAVLLRTLNLSGAYDLMCAVAIVYLLKTVLVEKEGLKGAGFNVLDLAVLVVVSVEILCYFTSTYRANSFNYLLEILFLSLFYQLVRFNVRREYQRVALFIIFSLFAFHISLAAVVTFANRYLRITSLGFHDVTSLRQFLQLYRPSEYPISEWITIFLVFLPFPTALFIRYRERFAAAWLFLLLVLITLVAILVTFSRGVYTAALAFFIVGSVLCWHYKLARLKQIIRFNLVLSLALLLFVAVTPLRKATLTTLSLFGTTSYVRSFGGRMSLWELSLGMARGHALVGVGAFNFPMQYMAYKGGGIDAEFVGRSLNYFLQILLEKGVLGLCAYCFLLFSFYRTSHIKMKRSGGDLLQGGMAVVFMAAYAAIIIRDLSYSSILTNKGVVTLSWFMFASNAQVEGKDLNILGGKFKAFKGRPILCLVLVGLLFLTAATKKHHDLEAAETSFRGFISSLQQERYEEAGGQIERAVALSPDNAYYLAGRALLRVRMMRVSFDQFLAGNSALGEKDAGHASAAVEDYERALELNPNDDSFHHNVGWLYLFLGRRQTALDHLRKASEIDGGIALYHVSLGLFYEREGRAEEAYREYASAIYLSPGLLDSRLFSYLREKDSVRAEELVTRCVTLLENQLSRDNNNPLLKGKLGKLYIHQGARDRAAQMLSQATAELPALSRPWFNLGYLYETDGKEREMKECYERALFLDPSFALPSLRLGEFYDRSNRRDIAVQYYTRAVNGIIYTPSEHATRVSRLYLSEHSVPDDAAPNGLLFWCSPTFDVAATSSRLAALKREAGDINSATHFEEVGRKFSR
jgi:tetratricopeptide (TPR) repeat protein/O-antigen ligase